MWLMDGITRDTATTGYGHWRIKALFRGTYFRVSRYWYPCVWLRGLSVVHGIEHVELSRYIHFRGSILFANHKANGVVTNIGLSR